MDSNKYVLQCKIVLSLSYDPGSLSAKEGNKSNNNIYPLNKRINKQIVLGEKYLRF